MVLLNIWYHILFFINKAPEIVQREGHNYSLDFYSLGALLHEMILGTPPFYSQNYEEMAFNILN